MLINQEILQQRVRGAAAIVSTGDDIESAESRCEAGLSHISGSNIFVRHDIAKPHLIKKRIQNMESIR